MYKTKIVLAAFTLVGLSACVSNPISQLTSNPMGSVEGQLKSATGLDKVQNAANLTNGVGLQDAANLTGSSQLKDAANMKNLIPSK